MESVGVSVGILEGFGDTDGMTEMNDINSLLDELMLVTGPGGPTKIKV